MAEKGAYLTGTAFIKPSIFEIIAHESFAVTLEPAFKKILTFLISCNPERYGHLLRWSDEGYMIFNLLLQRYYFQKYSASFSETFYGLKRITLANAKVEQKLSKKQVELSLLVTILFPYLRNKLSDLSQKYKIEEVDGYVSQSKWEKFYRNCVTKGHMVASMIYESMVLYNYILYISGKSQYTSPLLRLLSVTLTYAEPQTAISVSDLLRKIMHNSFGINDGIDILQRTVTRSIEFGAFFLQFLSWWNQQNYRTNLMSLPVPSPPKIPKIAERYKGICPVCCNAPHIHTVLSVSGYVFCYQCILPVIRKSGRCPVTNYPATEDDLIRLYLE